MSNTKAEYVRKEAKVKCSGCKDSESFIVFLAKDRQLDAGGMVGTVADTSPEDNFEGRFSKCDNLGGIVCDPVFYSSWFEEANTMLYADNTLNKKFYDKIEVAVTSTFIYVKSCQDDFSNKSGWETAFSLLPWAEYQSEQRVQQELEKAIKSRFNNSLSQVDYMKDTTWETLTFEQIQIALDDLQDYLDLYIIYAPSEAKKAESDLAQQAITEAKKVAKELIASKQDVSAKKVVLMSSVLICTKGAGVLTFFENGPEDEPPVAPTQNGFVYYYNDNFYVESHIHLSEHNGINAVFYEENFGDDIGFLHNEDEFPNSFDWKLTDDIFIDPNAMTKEQFINVLINKKAVNGKELLSEELMAQMYNLCCDYLHSSCFSEGTPFEISSSINNVYFYNFISERWSNKKGINPKVVLAAFKWESGYGGGSDNWFGVVGSNKGTNTPEGKTRDCIRRYLQYFYVGKFCDKEVFLPKDKTEIYLAKHLQYPHMNMDTHHTRGSGFHFDACNHAIYSLARYTTDTLDELIKRHKVIMDDEF